METIQSIKCYACGAEIGWLPPGSLDKKRLWVHLIPITPSGEVKSVSAIQNLPSHGFSVCDLDCLRKALEKPP